jgi:tripartite-type tricarboxylate transporter receptor subunit TctC
MKLAQACLLTVALLMCVQSVHAQTQGTVRILVGFPPGGAVDILARVFAETLSATIGRSVVVENRSGAGGQIAATVLKASLPDGNTLMVLPDYALTLYPYTVNAPPYDTLKDFVPVAHLGSFYSGFAVHRDVPAKDIKGWVEWAKFEAKNRSYGSPGAGSELHFFGLMVGKTMGVEMVHVPYRGTGPVIADLTAGQIPSAMLSLAAMLEPEKAGQIRILAQTGPSRSPVLPYVSTFKELGYPALELTGSYLMIAPSGVPDEVVARYQSSIVQAMRTPAIRQRMETLGLGIQEMSPAEIRTMLQAEHARWGPIVKASGFTPY